MLRSFTPAGHTTSSVSHRQMISVVVDPDIVEFLSDENICEITVEIVVSCGK